MTADTKPATPSLFTSAEMLAGSFTREFELLNGERVTVHLRFPPLGEAHTARSEFGKSLNERVLFAAIHLSNSLRAPAAGAAPASLDQLLAALCPVDLLAFEDLALQMFFGMGGLTQKREECAKLSQLLASGASLPPDGTVTAETAASGVPQPPSACAKPSEENPEHVQPGRCRYCGGELSGLWCLKCDCEPQPPSVGALPSRENPDQNMNTTPAPIPSEPSTPLPIATPETGAAALAATDFQAAYNQIVDGLQRGSALLDRITAESKSPAAN